MSKDNQLWMGVTPMGTDLLFDVPPEVAKTMLESGKKGSNYRIVNGKVMGRSTSVWFTNLDHGRRHQKLPLMTMADNLKFSKHKEINGKATYDRYDNYDAIEVPFTNAIPSDYDGNMGVPISFLDKYSPEQFEIIWQASGNTRASTPAVVLDQMGYSLHPDDRGGCAILGGRRTYDRIFIRHRATA